MLVPPEKLPASCPPAGQKGWDKHPRVYLQLSPQKPRQKCPYCGAAYVLAAAPKEKV
ncbi:MAG: zinc-finger domain-containing protein [Betaproteobacteria bacterium]|nr:zinc-finger domain-containing protein [Betaproteobacteria bacterium]